MAPPTNTAAKKPRILPRVPKPSSQPLNLDSNTSTVESFLIAYGDDVSPLPSTIRVLDEIVTDYIIETCHEAAAVAHHARRQKIKLDDFKFMLRKDATKLGRVSEMLEMQKELIRKRKAFDTDEGTVAKGADGEGDEGATPADKGKKDKEKEKDGGRDRDDGERRKKKKKEKKGQDTGSVRSG